MLRFKNVMRKYLSLSFLLKVWREIRLYVFAVVLVPLLIGVWLLLRAFLFDYFKVPTHSMMPTLLPGDEIVVNKMIMGARIYSEFEFSKTGQELKAWRTNGTRELKHNDIVVFNYPYHDWKVSFVLNQVYCKRIVGLPGDSLRIVDGWYKSDHYEGILGLESEQSKLAALTDSNVYPPSLATIPFDEHFNWNIRNFGPMYIPGTGDVIKITPYEATLYRILLEWETGKPLSIDWDKNIVMSGDEPLTRHRFLHNYYFMAGDNVLNSNDSRYWGLVPEEYVVGVVKFVIRPNEKKLMTV